MKSLRDRKHRVWKFFIFSGEPFSLDELVDKLKGRESKPTLLIDFIEEGNKKMFKRVGTEITKATYYKYKKCLEYMQEFLIKNYKAKNFLLVRINVGFLDNYFRFLRFDKIFRIILALSI